MRLILIIGALVIVAACGGSGTAQPTEDARPTADVIVSTATDEPNNATIDASACKFVPPDGFDAADRALDFGADGRPDGVGITFVATIDGKETRFDVPVCARDAALKRYNSNHPK